MLPKGCDKSAGRNAESRRNLNQYAQLIQIMNPRGRGSCRFQLVHLFRDSNQA